MIVVTRSQMQDLDRRTITEAKVPGLTLMENAGAAVVAAMERSFGILTGKSVAVVCGKGHNGGDGLVVARHLKQKRARPQVLLCSPETALSADANTMYRRFTKVAGKTATRILPSDDQLSEILNASDLVVDALLGTGLSTTVKDFYRSAIQAMNGSGRPVISVDLPSGLDSDTGTILGDTVRASLTVTLGLPKLGLYLGQGIDCSGSVHVADIGIPRSYARTVDSLISLITLEEARKILQPRKLDGHKGTYGHAGIIAGSVGKTGAAALAAQAALRTGTGLVTVATPAGVNGTLESKLLEVMTCPMPETTAQTLSQAGLEALLSFANTRSATAIGPGLTTHPETASLVRAMVPRLERPCVLDADALNALAGHSAELRHAKTSLVLTPHPGEMARLVEGMTTQSVQADRIGVAGRFARSHQVVLVLKGARTVVARPDGHIAICPTGNPGMATAGSGDVLTGMMVGLLAQGHPVWEAACAATYFHGLAGDLTAAALGHEGMIAGDLLGRIPYALTKTA